MGEGGTKTPPHPFFSPLFVCPSLEAFGLLGTTKGKRRQRTALRPSTDKAQAERTSLQVNSEEQLGWELRQAQVSSSQSSPTPPQQRTPPIQNGIQFTELHILFVFKLPYKPVMSKWFA